MRLITVLQDACASGIKIKIPAVIATSTEMAHVELMSIACEAAELIAQSHEWSELVGDADLTGNGLVESFPLPENFDRLRRDTEVFDEVAKTRVTKILSLNDWKRIDVSDIDSIYRRWIIYNRRMHVKPALPLGHTATFFYQSKNLVLGADGVFKETFTKDDDQFRLSDRLLKLAVIWLWKRSKGQPFDADKKLYDNLLAKLQSADQGAETIFVGRRRSYTNTMLAYPISVAVDG